jgi:glycolate oxidase
VTCRGAGSSATGAAVPLRGGWVLDLSALDAISIDPVNRVAEVGAGTLTSNLQAKAESLGLFYPPDPSSKKYSTMGGNIACNAGGMRCVKYGVTRDYVLGLRGYLADGRFVRWGLPVRKFVSGLNLRDLWIGSEGTLGVVTGAALKLVPRPAKRWMALFAFSSETAALGAVAGLFREGHDPSILEFLDRQSVAGAERYSGRRIFEGLSRPALLIIELDGSPGEVRARRKALLDFMKGRAKGVREARSAVQSEALLEVRRTCSQAMFMLADTKLNEDVVVPVDRQVDLLRYTRALKKEIGLPTPTFGHAGDGNLHVHIMYDRGDAAQRLKAKVGIRRLMRKVVELGGVITGEHGIGLAKSTFLPLQHNKAELEAMRAVKQALDPKGILNPGKIFEPFEVWNHQPVEVRMPWDKH